MMELNASPVKNYLRTSGFTMVSNILLDHQDELGITGEELVFIIKVLRQKNGSIIHDRDIDSTVTPKTLSRRRNSLKNKGYLTFKIVKTQNEDGTFETSGIIYDLTQLEDKLQAISDKIQEKKNKELTKKVIVEEKKVVETEEEADGPLADYCADYKACYGIPYKVTQYEMDYYNKLDDNNKKLLTYIFEYCKDRNLLGTITPRLSLFFKTFRLNDLRKYCSDNGYLEINYNFKTRVVERNEIPEGYREVTEADMARLAEERKKYEEAVQKLRERHEQEEAEKRRREEEEEKYIKEHPECLDEIFDSI